MSRAKTSRIGFSLDKSAVPAVSRFHKSLNQSMIPTIDEQDVMTVATIGTLDTEAKEVDLLDEILASDVDTRWGWTSN